ncbi:MAG: cation:dicarboxylase symporter family transporter, partial [Erysipelotrichaceae bacterium]|nr:cation:dicarboxylase symporter family transporter [Erysipelotrichaceae bacterium]
EGLLFIENTLNSYHYSKNKLKEDLETCRHELALMAEYADDGADIQIKISRWYTTVTVELSSKGRTLPAENRQMDIPNEQFSPQSRSAMKDLIKTSHSDKVTHSYRDEYNYTKIHLGNKERLFAFRTLFAIVFALIFSSIVMFLLPEGAVKACEDYVFTPVQTLFLNLLQLVTAPAVFFSIMTAVAKFASFRDLERVGKKTIAGFIISAILAVLLGVFLFWLFQPSTEFAGVLSSMVKTGGKSKGILDTIISSVPNNVISPFLNVDALQLLVVASLCGITLAKASKESSILRNAAEALHKFFSTMVDIVTFMIPSAVFFVTSLMIFMFGFKAMFITLHIFILVVFGFMLMILLSFMSVAIGGKVRLIPFVKKMVPYMYEVFWNGSSVS